MDRAPAYARAYLKTEFFFCEKHVEVEFDSFESIEPIQISSEIPIIHAESCSIQDCLKVAKFRKAISIPCTVLS
ncbi:MAG: hypothetical protein KGI50_06250 [Patescibacteria group bacterium]|nr:hypothetical protein [Patescibacteria group bacterium]